MKAQLLKPVEFIADVNIGNVCLVDVRSPGEFRQGHIPGAHNIPLLNDEERHIIGITYKEEGQQAAVLKGFEICGHKFHAYIREAFELADGRPVHVYCWRGGLRSNTMAWLFAMGGLQVKILEGGYKSYRHLIHELFAEKRDLIMLAGKTGVGKSEILQALQASGQNVLDLEQLAHHKGSSFGGLGQEPQDTQEEFENKIGWHLLHMKPGVIWLESESRFIGKLRIPDAFFDHMQQARIIEARRDLDGRMERILHEYGGFSREILEEKTRAITKRMGGDQVKESVTCLNTGDMKGWLRPLLVYYDKTYTHSFGDKRIESSLDTDGLSIAQVTEALLRMVENTNK